MRGFLFDSEKIELVPNIETIIFSADDEVEIPKDDERIQIIRIYDNHLINIPRLREVKSLKNFNTIDLMNSNNLIFKIN